MHNWKIGESVIISDHVSPFFGKKGIVKELGVKGGLYILLDGQDKEIYFPWGFDIIR